MASWLTMFGPRKRGALLGNYALAAVDQSIVSGISFLTLIALAHWTNPAELGTYVLASSALGVLTSVQHALIATPYSIQRHRVAAPASEQAFAGLAQCAGLAGCSTIALGILGIAFRYLEHSQLSAILLALAAVTPFVLTREFVREVCFAHFQMRRAFALDLASVSIQLAAICILAYTSRLSALSAVAVIGILSAVPAVFSLAINRKDFSWPEKNIGDLITNSFRLGRWLLMSRSAILLQSYAGIWISGLIAGLTATAIYSACVSVVAFANPFLFGLYNVLTPRAAVALKEQGHTGLWKSAVRDAVLLGTIMGAFVVVVALGGEQLMSMLYPAEYSGYGVLIILLACAAFVSAIGIPPSNGLASLECGREVAAIAVASSVFTLALVVLLLERYGLVGAGVAVLIGSLATTAARWIMFRRGLPELRDSKPATAARP